MQRVEVGDKRFVRRIALRKSGTDQKNLEGKKGMEPHVLFVRTLKIGAKCTICKKCGQFPRSYEVTPVGVFIRSRKDQNALDQ